MTVLTLLTPSLGCRRFSFTLVTKPFIKSPPKQTHPNTSLKSHFPHWTLLASTCSPRTSASRLKARANQEHLTVLPAKKARAPRAPAPHSAPCRRPSQLGCANQTQGPPPTTQTRPGGQDLGAGAASSGKILTSGFTFSHIFHLTFSGFLSQVLGSLPQGCKLSGKQMQRGPSRYPSPAYSRARGLAKGQGEHSGTQNWGFPAPPDKFFISFCFSIVRVIPN